MSQLVQVPESMQELRAELETTLRLIEGERLPISRYRLSHVLCVFQHWEDFLRAQSFAEIEPMQLQAIVDTIDTNATLLLPADYKKAAKERHRCARCQADFEWMPIEMPWLCSRSEDCPLCYPLCVSCLGRGHSDPSANCPLSGMPVKSGQAVTCQCGRLFQGIQKIPVHKRMHRDAAPTAGTIDVIAEINEAQQSLASFMPGRDTEGLSLAMVAVGELRERVAELERENAKLRGS